MATTTLNTRLKLKFDTYANWTSADPVLLYGEAAVVDLGSNTGSIQNAPTILMKVGDGVKKFSELGWVSGLAADVYAWAKQSSIPVQKIGTGNVVTSITWDPATNGFKYDTTSVATSEALADLVSRVDTIEGDYLKNADKTALQTNIDKKVNTADFETFKTSNTNAINTAEQNAKDYANGLAGNYDAKGSADAALASAKTYTDNLANGAVKSNTEAITAIKDGSSLDSFADVETALAGKQATGDYATKSEAQGYANAKDAAIAAAKSAADTAQADVDALEAKVGTVPSDKTVVQMIEEAQTAATYDDTAIKNRVSTIEGDYLKSADKTELSGLVTTEKERAMGVESGLRTDVDAATAAIGVLNGTGAGSVTKTVADEIAKVVGDAPDALDTLEEIAAWINAHPESVADLNAKIKANTTAIGDEKTRAEGAEAALQSSITNLSATVSSTYETKTDASAKLAEAKSYADQAETDAVASANSYTDGKISTVNTEVAKKANTADLAAIAFDGNVKNLVQTSGDYVIFDCGTSTVNI